MSKWCGIAIAGIWIGIGIMSFNVGESITTIAEYGLGATGVIALLEYIL